jgi:hypothetical protein
MVRILLLSFALALAACESAPKVEVPDPEGAAEAVAEAATVSLDGKTFDVKAVTKDGEGPDTLIFTDGTFESTDCRQYGFGPAKYTATGEGTVAFTVTTTSEKEGKIAWTGKVDSDAISGSAVWSKDGQADITYTFSGSIQAAGEKAEEAPASAPAE